MYKSPIVQALEELRKRNPYQTMEYQLDASIRGYAVYDWLVWELLLKEMGPEEGSRCHADLWATIGAMSFKGYKETLGIIEVDVPALIQITKRYFENVGNPFDIIEVTEDKAVGYVRRCPFWEYIVEVFGSSDKLMTYGKQLAVCTRRVLESFVEEANIIGKVEASLDKAICLGDKVCQVTYKWIKK